MKTRLRVLAWSCAAVLGSLPLAARQHGGWCACGQHSTVPTVFEIDHVVTAFQQSADTAFSRWDAYSDVFTWSLGEGAAGSASKNEIIFFNSATTLSQYGFTLDSNTLGVTYINPSAAFGSPPFNACPAPAGTTCGSFSQTYVILNYDFWGGWTTAPPSFDSDVPANHMATALHELGHSLGIHHDFDNLTTMNYYEDYAAQYLSRSDGRAAREHFPTRARTAVDIATYPFRFDGFQYAGTTVASVTPSIVQPGEYLTLHDFTVENVGSETVYNAQLVIYLSEDTVVTGEDYAIGTLNWSTFDTWWDSSGSTFLVPPSVPPGTYYIGAVFYYETYQYGSQLYGVVTQDPITYNNSWVLDATRAVTVSSCTDDLFEPDDFCFGSYRDLGQLETHKHCDEDWVWFGAVPGRTYRIETSSLVGGADTVLALHPDCGEELAYDDDGGAEFLASRIDWTATVGGPIDIRVGEFASYSNDFGDKGYAIQVTCIANCGSSLPDDLLIERKTYDPGVTVEEACSSITAREKVYIPSGAEVTWRAPRVALGRLVFVGQGGNLVVNSQSPVGCPAASLQVTVERRR